MNKTLASLLSLAAVLGGCGARGPSDLMSESVDKTSSAIMSDSQLPSYSYGGLPTPGAVGKLARVSDTTKGLWMDNGTQWVSMSGGVINVREFGALGDGTTSDFAAIQAAVNAAVAAGGGTVWFPTPPPVQPCGDAGTCPPPPTYKLSATLGVPANVGLQFSTGAVLAVSPAQIFTINGPLQTPDSKIFEALGNGSSGTISFGATQDATTKGNSFIEHVNPKWWGATSVPDTDQTTDSAPMFQAALDTFKPVFVPDGLFNLGSGLTLKGLGQSLFGNSHNANVLRYLPGTGAALSTGYSDQSIYELGLAAGSTDPLRTCSGIHPGPMYGGQANNITIEKFFRGIECNTVGGGASCLLADGINVRLTLETSLFLSGTQEASFTNFVLSGGARGITLTEAAQQNYFDQGQITGAALNGIMINRGSHNSFNNVVVKGSGNMGVYIDSSPAFPASVNNTFQNTFITGSGQTADDMGIEIDRAYGTKILNSTVVDDGSNKQTYGVYMGPASRGSIVSNNILSPNKAGAFWDNNGTFNRLSGNSENNDATLAPTSDVTHMNGTFVFSKEITVPSVKIGTNTMQYGSGPPSTGPWVQGDIVWNTQAAPSGNAGWIYTGATTGWKAFAPIDQ